MARSGGLGATLNPLGSGSLGGGLSQYDIGADLANLEVYRVEVAWGNGLATDDEYLSALNKALAATDPETQKRESAQNKLDDAVYRIGRSKADTQGLDALVTYDQAALAKMKPDNVRYRDVKGTLDSELAQRRSRDYGRLVLDYNKGTTSTQTLLSWVKATVAAISPDDPDYANWQGTQQDLTDRVAGEKDSKVYQDFQQGRMRSGPFLAYLEQRRAGFGQESPEYADWTRRLEDARKQVNDANQAKADGAFFNSYEEGHKSDAQYLGYLRNRIRGMKADDPDRPSWQHRLNQAAFSLAEDKLRFDVEHKNKPLSSLVSFYRSYRATLNPGSAEYRTITRALDSIGRSGGGGGRGSTKADGTASGAVTGKAIPKYDQAGVFSLMTINPHAPKKDQAAAKKFFDLNYTSLENARQRGDNVWLFYDPRKPGAAVAARNPDGTPVLDRNGKPIMVRGSAYVAVSDDAFGHLNVLRAQYQFALADIALADKDPGQYAFHLKEGLNAQDKARLVDSQHVAKSFDAFYQTAQDGIDSALRRGDYATALNLSTDVANRLGYEMQNPQLDETRRDRLDRLGEKLAGNPLIPKVDTATGQQIGGAVNLAASEKDAAGNFTGVTLNDGWHHVLDKVDASGAPDWGLQYDKVQDGSWEASHTEVTTMYGDNIVRGDVSTRNAGVNSTVFVPTPDGQIRVDQSVKYLTFTDEHGQVVKAYSIDGKHWIRSLSGTPPQIEVSGNLKNAADGSGIVGDDGKLVFKANTPGDKTGGYTFVGDPSTLGFYGQSAIGANRDAQALTGAIAQAGRMFGFSLPTSQSGDLGAPGQHMELLTMGDDGSLTFLSQRQQDTTEQAALAARRREAGLAVAPTKTRGLGRAQGQLGYLGQVGETLKGLTPLGIDLSGILSFGVGLAARPTPPAHLGPLAARGGGRGSPSLPALAALPALRDAAPPEIIAGKVNRAALPPLPALKAPGLSPTARRRPRPPARRTPTTPAAVPSSQGNLVRKV